MEPATERNTSRTQALMESAKIFRHVDTQMSENATHHPTAKHLFLLSAANGTKAISMNVADNQTSPRV